MLLRVPYTSPLPSFSAIPGNATTLPIAIRCVVNFLQSTRSTLVLSGAGISVESGLPDYRGTAGTYVVNKDFKPVFYGDFVSKDAARKRYWARSFLGWRGVKQVRPNRGHFAVGRLWEGGWLNGVITQNVDSLHTASNPSMPIINLHGTLSTLICLTCQTHHPRQPFQAALQSLNPTMQSFLKNIIEDPSIPVTRNPDGDIDVPGAPYSTFRYPPCPHCLKTHKISTDSDGAMISPSSGPAAGILKPTVVFFGESLPPDRKIHAEQMVDDADAIMVLGSSLATYSAWRLVKRAKEQGKKIGIINLGGVRNEETFWQGEDRVSMEQSDGSRGFRVEFGIGDVLDGALDILAAEGGRDVRSLSNEEVQAGKLVEQYAP